MQTLDTSAYGLSHGQSVYSIDDPSLGQSASFHLRTSSACSAEAQQVSSEEPQLGEMTASHQTQAMLVQTALA
jgi:hypothetical protein